MVVTSMNFMHIRSIAALARVCKKRIRHLRGVLQEELKLEAKEKKSEEMGDIEQTRDSLSKLLIAFSKEEDDEKIIEMDQEIIVKEEMKKEFDEEKDIQEAILILKKYGFDEQSKELGDTERKISRDMEKGRDLVKKIVVEEMNMDRDRQRISYVHVMSNEFLEGKAFHVTDNELDKIREVMKIEGKLQNLINELKIEAKEKNLDKINHTIKDIRETAENLIEDINLVIQMIFSMLRLIHMVHLHLLTAIFHDGPDTYLGKISKLHKEGFPDNILTQLTGKEKELQDKVAKDTKELFQMARWLGFEINSGIEQN